MDEPMITHSVGDRCEPPHEPTPTHASLRGLTRKELRHHIRVLERTLVRCGMPVPQPERFTRWADGTWTAAGDGGNSDQQLPPDPAGTALREDQDACSGLSAAPTDVTVDVQVTGPGAGPRDARRLNVLRPGRLGWDDEY